jgi:hypothetical protein
MCASEMKLKKKMIRNDIRIKMVWKVCIMYEDESLEWNFRVPNRKIFKIDAQFKTKKKVKKNFKIKLKQ